MEALDRPANNGLIDARAKGLAFKVGGFLGGTSNAALGAGLRRRRQDADPRAARTVSC